jgi:hypothetical protein
MEAENCQNGGNAVPVSLHVDHKGQQQNKPRIICKSTAISLKQQESLKGKTL